MSIFAASALILTNESVMEELIIVGKKEIVLVLMIEDITYNFTGSKDGEGTGFHRK